MAHIDSILRSLFRLQELQNMKSPEILIDNEKQILAKRMVSLTPEELLAIAVQWSEYQISQKQKEVIDDHLFQQSLDLEKYN